MNIAEVILQAKTYMRRDTFFTDAEWRHLINTAQMEFTSLVEPLDTDFEVHLQEGVYEYDMNEANLYRLTEDALYARTDLEGATSYTSVPLKTRRDVRYITNGDLFSTSGTPTYIYPLGQFSIGVYPVPDASCDGQRLIVHGQYFPVEINSTTAATHELEFQVVDHPAIVLGVVLAAERIDEDIASSRDYANQYMNMVFAARARRANRFSGKSKMVTHGR